MTTCESCANWAEEHHAAWDVSGTGMRVCQGVKERWTITDNVERAPEGTADSDETYNEYAKRKGAALLAAGAFVEDGSEYMAQLVTAPGFSCSLWKQKQETEGR